jgi:hypothetical protein
LGNGWGTLPCGIGGAVESAANISYVVATVKMGQRDVDWTSGLEFASSDRWPASVLQDNALEITALSL